MSQVDHRISSATKRARTDGGRREDDWTCSSCGNVNFSFRTTCNMRNCTQPRPTDHSSKFAVKPMQAHQGYLSVAAPHVSPGRHSSMYMGGAPPYGPPVFNGTSMPPYEVPFSGGSAYNYNYGSRFSPGSPYRPLHLSGPPPFSDGPIMRAGGMYGLPPVIDHQYRLGFPMSPTIGVRPVIFPEDNAHKASDGARDNDWACPKCGNLNFSFRTVCNMRKCNTPKPGPPQRGGKHSKNSPKPETPEGSWKCEKCNNINYPFRTKCNKQNCGADKPTESKKSQPATNDANNQ